MHRSSEAPRHGAALSEDRLRNSETGSPPKVKYRNSYMSLILPETALTQPVAYVQSRTSPARRPAWDSARSQNEPTTRLRL